VAGGVITAGGVFADDHPQPIRDETWAVFDALIKRCTNLRANTYEGDGHPEPVARRVLQRLRVSLPPKRGEGQGGGAKPVTKSAITNPWNLFDEAHSTPGPERDFRLAVLAERLDAEVPLARAAVAPTFELLAPFMAGSAFKDWFREGTRALGDAFLRWAMTQVRNPQLAGADALVSLELWARTTWTAARKNDVAHLDTRFPVDLTEALHAAYALKRHLRGRQLLDASGWEGLLQCARRAPKTPWPVRLSAEGARVVINPID
jgi:hypothetical protein